MEKKTKYQYSYFIYPYIIDENKYDKYLLKLLQDKHCKIKMWEKGKDLNLYTYFLPQVRDYLFWSFSYSNDRKRKLEELDIELKSVLLSKYPSTVFEYNLGENVQGKTGEENGIFFNIEKLQIVCFKTGICFLVFKTIIDEDASFSDVLDFNYKFRDIPSTYSSLKNYENIRLQTGNFKNMKELSEIIKNIIGQNKDAKEMNLEEERFLVYSYICLSETDWNKEEDFNNLKDEFMKFSNILPSKNQTNFSESSYKSQLIEPLKYIKMGITKQGTVLLTSSIYTDYYTKVPFAYENEYLYTYLLTLYKKIYLKKMNLEFKRTKDFTKTRNKFLDFTKNIWIQEITQDEQGNMLCEKWKKTLELEYLYAEIKNKYDIVYKDLNIEKNRRINYFIITILLGTLAFNIINFILLFFK